MVKVKFMKPLTLLLISVLILAASCKKQRGLSDVEKENVNSEVRQFIKIIDSELETANVEAYKENFLNTDELAVASQGQLITSYNALCDTIDAHLSVMQKQSIQAVDEQIFVIDREHAVISTSKVTTITFKNGVDFTMSYAWTLLLVKRDGKWKIAHAHN